jgi:hypothetical protein
MNPLSMLHSAPIIVGNVVFYFFAMLFIPICPIFDLTFEEMPLIMCSQIHGGSIMLPVSVPLED